MAPPRCQGQVLGNRHVRCRAAKRILEDPANESGPQMLGPTSYVSIRQANPAFIHEERAGHCI